MSKNKLTNSLWVSVLVFLIVTATQAQVNLNNGLIAHLPLNGNGSDISGNNNNASIVESFVFEGIDRFENFPGSMRFAGGASRAKMSFNQPLLNNRVEYTVSFWFWLEAQNGNGMNIFGQDNILEVGHYVSPSRLVFYHPTSGAINYNLSTPILNNWRHVVITGNSTEINIYINGTLVATRSGNFSTGSNSFHTNIGGHVLNQTTTNWLRGGFDDLRIYNRVITNDEIVALYAANTPEITITSLSNSTFCAGDNISLSFSASGEILQNNIYRLQMSDGNGDFTTPVIIGTLSSNDLSGTFNTIIPNGTPSGTNYRFRVTSSLVSAVSNSTSACIINGVLGDIPASTYQFVGEVNDKIYYKSSGTSGWFTSQNTSISNGGHLATIPDSTSNYLLFYNARSDRPHIGFQNKGNGFEWVNNDNVGFTNWAAGQPVSNNHAEMRFYDGVWIAVSNTSSQKHYMELNPQGLNTTFCTNDDINLDAFNLPGATYLWTGPNGFSSTDRNAVIAGATGVNQGTYQLTYTLNGCVSPVLSKEIRMNALPGNSSVSALNNQICPGESTQIIIENSQSNLTYQLYNVSTSTNVGNAQTGNGDKLFLNTGSINSNTEFNIIVDNINTGCNSVTPNLEIKMLPVPDAPTTTDDEVCNGGVMTLTADGASGNEYYNWYKDASGTITISGLTGNALNIDTNVTANYYVSITGNNGCESPLTQVTGTVINPLNPPVDIISGLILHYKFDGNLADSSGYGYNATVSGSNSFVNDRNGNPSSAFNSIATNTPGNNWLNAGNPAKVQQLTNQITISMWIKQTQTWFGTSGTDGYMPLINKYNGSTGIFTGLRMFTPNPWQNRVIWTINGSNVLQSNTNVPVGTWHHIVCTYNGSQLKIYQNGVLTGTRNQTGNVPNTAVNLFLGRWAQGTPSGEITYRGEWDEVKIFNRALNLNEVQTLYNNESVAFVNEPFCDGEGNLELTTFNFTGAIYQWTGPNGFSSNQQNPPVIVNADSATYSGVYSLLVTDANGCTSPLQTTKAIIHPIPPSPITINDTVCGSGNAVLEAQTSLPGVTYSWYTVAVGGTPIAGQTNATLTINDVTSAQTRYVSVIKNGCIGPRTMVEAIYVNNIDPDLNLMGDIVCQGNIASVIIQNSENNVTYEAFLGETSMSSVFAGNGNNLSLNIIGDLNLGINTLTVEATAIGCNGVKLNNYAEVEVLPNVTGTDIISACETHTWIDGNTYTSSNNTATFLLSNQYGCDSLVTLNLSINNNTGTDIISACGNYIWIDGVNYTSSNNTATFMLTNQNGCDSLVTLNLTINNSNSGTDVINACDSYIWIDGNTYTSNNNSATFVLNNQFGCDSLVTLNLTINSSTAGLDEITACDSYTWIDGINYTSSNNTATHILSNQIGCDSLVSLNLTINNSNTITDFVNSCESYTWIDGNTYTSSNNSATIVFTNQFGCDSTIVLNLNIPVIDLTITNTSPLLTSNQANATYQWVDCQDYSIISGETGQDFIATQNGSYAVVINYQNCIDTSFCKPVFDLSIYNELNLGISIYPNPTTGVFNVLSEHNLIGSDYQVYSIDGRVIKSGKNTVSPYQFTIDLNEQSPGVYYLKVNVMHYSSSFKIIKN
jgi:hypothetical protein